MRVALARASFFVGMALVFGIGCCTKQATISDTPTHASRPAKVWKRTVLIDVAFSSVERAAVIDGFDAWRDAVGTDLVQLRYGIVSTADAFMPAARSDEIHVIRLVDSPDVDKHCETTGKIGCWIEPKGHIYVGVDQLGLHYLARTISHEAGHAAGLSHEQPPSVMADGPDRMTPQPTEKDAAMFRGSISR